MGVWDCLSYPLSSAISLGSWEAPYFFSCRSGTQPARSDSAPSPRATTAVPTGPSLLMTSPRGAPSCQCLTGSRMWGSMQAPTLCSCWSVSWGKRDGSWQCSSGPQIPSVHLSLSFLNKGQAREGLNLFRQEWSENLNHDLANSAPANHL